MLLKEAPHLIGNLEGVPYSVRGAANALDLRRTIATATSDLKTERGKTERLALQRQLTTLGLSLLHISEPTRLKGDARRPA